MVKSYKELLVWQKAMNLVILIYKLTEDFPKEEVYGLTSQIRRAAVSVPSNIAEGYYRGTTKSYLQFLRISFASGAELETQVLIAKNLSKTSKLDFSKVDSLLEEVMKMLNTMIKKLQKRSP